MLLNPNIYASLIPLSNCHELIITESNRSNYENNKNYLFIHSFFILKYDPYRSEFNSTDTSSG